MAIASKWKRLIRRPGYETRTVTRPDGSHYTEERPASKAARGTADARSDARYEAGLAAAHRDMTDFDGES